MTLPAEWSLNAEILDGFDQIDKSELLEVPFRITELFFRTSDKGFSTVEITAEKVDGVMVVFTDSSSGVREQLANYLADRGEKVTDGQVFELSLVVPRGLRVSKYETEVRGKKVQGTTYYLTTSGNTSRAKEAVKAGNKPRAVRVGKQGTGQTVTR